MKKMTVLDLAVQVVNGENKIPVEVFDKSGKIAEAESLPDLAAHGRPGVLGSKIVYVKLGQICRIYVKL